MGKVTVVKAHALSQIQFLASSIHTPEWAIKEIVEIVYSFIWDGTYLISKEKASKAWKEGGITVPMIEHMCKAAFVKTTLRAKQYENELLWASNHVYELRKIGGVAALHPQTDLLEIKKKGTPTYILLQVEAWQFIQKLIDPIWSKEITKFSPVCYNKKIAAPPVGRSKKRLVIEVNYLLKAGLNTVGQWFDSRAERIKWQTAKEKGLHETALLEWQKVSKALRIEKIRILNDETLQIEEIPIFSPYFHTKKGVVNFPDISQKRILHEIAQTVEYIPNNTKVKFSKTLELTEDDLGLAFKKLRKDNPCTRMQEFQFKLLSGRVFTNKLYAKFGRKTSKKCTFCDEESQDFEHTYILCPTVQEFRRKLSEDWPGEPMDKKRWFLGVSNTNDTLEQCKNIIAKEVTHYIFKMNWAGENLSLVAFKNWLKSEEEPEEALAFRVNKIFDHHVKWSHIQVLLH